jgi:sulfite exporter TauE/SafE
MSAALGILLASLAGSPHCAAMCGPFVAFYATGASPAAPRRWMHLAYNGGRLVAYLALGIVAGALGAGIERAGALVGIARGAAIVAGVLMVAWGLDTLVAVLGWRRSVLHVPPALQRAVSRVLRAAGGMPATLRAGATGLATALLPCGWLYAFVAAAAGTASPAHGALVMLLFWGGTLPVMVGLGLGVQRLAGPLRARLPLVTATAVVAIGLLTITGRLRPIPIPVAGAEPALVAPDPHAGHR